MKTTHRIAAVSLCALFITSFLVVGPQVQELTSAPRMPWDTWSLAGATVIALQRASIATAIVIAAIWVVSISNSRLAACMAAARRLTTRRSLRSQQRHPLSADSMRMKQGSVRRMHSFKTLVAATASLTIWTLTTQVTLITQRWPAQPFDPCAEALMPWGGPLVASLVRASVVGLVGLPLLVAIWALLTDRPDGRDRDSADDPTPALVPHDTQSPPR